MRFRDGLAAAAVLGLLAAAALALRGGGEVEGTARVIDGDTLALAGKRVRLAGIDAPELAQTCERAGASYRCGEAARDALAALIGDALVSCQVSGRDRYGRDLAVCRAGEADLGASLVSRGVAVANGAYLAEELAARGHGLGLWAGRFDLPAEWRKRHGAPGRTSSAGEGCARPHRRTFLGLAQGRGGPPWSGCGGGGRA